jgi:hypothetical protein
MTHDAGIGIYGSFMFGFEGDDKDVFQRTLDFCEDNEIELALFSALFPIHGSHFYQQLQSAGRIFETDVTKFNGQYSTFHPKNMTSEELEKGLAMAMENILLQNKHQKAVIALDAAPTS